jgi:iron complex outermembrane recepter protein
MKSITIRNTLMSCAAALTAAAPVTAFAAVTPEAAPANTSTETTDQSTSATQIGQANDKGALTSADIIVIGSRLAQDAPITSSLKTTQPQAAVSREYIENSLVATADFNQIVALTPGVTITGTANGTGFSESKVQIRGFQDGEYNVTYDSIPFADTNNPTHHSTAFFPSNTIETIVVDRGPGNASQLGQATYGGNINIYSRAVKDKMGGQIEAIGGIWNTFLGRAEFQSGAIEKLGGAKLVLAGQYLRSDGALTFSPIESKNLFGKAVIPIGSHNTLTILATWNRNYYYQSDTARGATCGSATSGIPASAPNPAFPLAAIDSSGKALTQLTAQNCAATSLISRFGLNYGMNNDPTSADYFKYNRTDKTTDFSIIRLQSDLGGGFTMNNRLYIYGYTNNTFSGNGTTTAALVGGVPTITTGPGTVVNSFNTTTVPVNATTNPNGRLIVAVRAPATDVSGYDKLNKYRTLGYIGQLNYEFSLGEVRLGGWFEHAATDRHLLNLNRTTGALNYNQAFNNGSGLAAQNALPASTIANISYVQHSGWNQYQLFGEFEFRPIEGLSITPGVKYVHFQRSIAAIVNQTSRTPNNSKATWTKTLPFATINWAATKSWSFYGQYAQGMYVPDLSSFYSPSLTAAAQANQAQTLSQLRPQTTTNYQIGSVWHGTRVSVDVDAYIINVNNKIAASTLATDPPNTLINIGRVEYKGTEGQISVSPIDGLTLFGNAAYNIAKNVSTGRQIARASKFIEGLGAFYSSNGFKASYTHKFTGAAYANEYANATGLNVFANPTTGERLYRIAPYNIGDFAISQEIGANFRIAMTVSNVFNKRAITAIGTSAAGAPTTVLNGQTYQTGYGQLDAFNFLPPRSAQVSVQVRF